MVLEMLKFDLDTILSFINKTAAQAFAVSLMSGAFLALRERAWFGFERLPEFSEPSAGILLLVSSTVWIGSLLKICADQIINQINKIQMRRKNTKREARIIESLSELNDGELKVLSYLVVNNQQHFVAPSNDHALTPLIKKGLLVYTAAGLEDLMSYPYAVPQFVWERIKDDERMHNKALDSRSRRVRAPWGYF